MVQAGGFVTQPKQKLLLLAGPTAVGKTNISLRLARKFDAEIVGADSMQIYRGMDIGTGKITAEEAAGIPHHMIDVVDANESYSVGRYADDARKVIAGLKSRGKNVIVAGGTGLYLNALIGGYNLADAGRSDELRKQYAELAIAQGNGVLWEILKERDPESAIKISANDTKRLIRALEIAELTGETKSKRATISPESEYDVLLIVLTCERAQLYERINLRVDKMLEYGLENEVRRLIPYRDCQSMQAIGYKEFINYFDKKISYTETVAAIKQHTRNYAKRQMTFFRWMKAKNKVFIDASNNAEILETATQFWP